MSELFLRQTRKNFYENNNIIQYDIQCEEVAYKSVDTVVEADEAGNYSPQKNYSLHRRRMPSHVFHLKIGAPIIMLRNINQPKLCNGARLTVRKKQCCRSKILTGPFKSENILIPRIPMIPTSMLPFQSMRLQFPIRLAFAITINNAQGQFSELSG